MKTNRPVYLNLFQYKFPVTAIASILHRISGFILFLVLPICLCLLSKSLAGETEFNSLVQWFSHPFYKWALAGCAVALFYHLVAGLRHILMDCHLGDSLKGGRLGAYAVIALGVLFALLMGVYTW